MTDLFLCPSTCASDPVRLRITPATPLKGAAAPPRGIPCFYANYPCILFVCSNKKHYLCKHLEN
jgi:hypothetical protein